MIKKLNLFLPALLLATIVLGCATFGGKELDPGADPLVVDCESLQTMAKPTFDGVLKLDDTNRAFWKEKAPEFHAFCEWLREPISLRDYMDLPRNRAMQMQLTWVKADYKAGKASSNDFFTAIFTFKSVLSQASAWMLIVTNQPNLK